MPMTAQDLAELAAEIEPQLNEGMSERDRIDIIAEAFAQVRRETLGEAAAFCRGHRLNLAHEIAENIDALATDSHPSGQPAAERKP